MPGEITVADEAAGAPVDGLPLSAVWRAQLLDASILAAAVVARARPSVPASLRMVVLNETRRSGLADSPPVMDIAARFDRWSRLTVDPRNARRLLARHMDAFVGTPWAPIILRVAEAVAHATIANDTAALQAASLVALRGVRTSLGICWPMQCGPGN
jgi:hypothetical protein